jgi:hypothetical protein
MGRHSLVTVTTHTVNLPLTNGDLSGDNSVTGTESGLTRENLDKSDN